ncbi:WhiB family transcriptional regulator [Mycobacterium sp. MBM]|nr:WhiB family transcriptional regulator [Mycobacterium sp. MBM]
MSRYPAVDLLAVVLRQLPALPGALCRNRSELFDSEEPADVATAVSLCERCPALDACRAWVTGLSYPARPAGVVAGRRYHRRPRRGPVT